MAKSGNFEAVKTFSEVHLNMLVDKIDKNMMRLLNWAKIIHPKKAN